jgi:hypothetical protein
MTNQQAPLTKSEERAVSLRAAINERAERLRELDSPELHVKSGRWDGASPCGCEHNVCRYSLAREALKAQIRDLELELSGLS